MCQFIGAKLALHVRHEGFRKVAALLGDLVCTVLLDNAFETIGVAGIKIDGKSYIFVLIGENDLIGLPVVLLYFPYQRRLFFVVQAERKFIIVSYHHTPFFEGNALDHSLLNIWLKLFFICLSR